MKRIIVAIITVLWAGAPMVSIAQIPKPLNVIGYEELKYDLSKAYPLVDNDGTLCGTYSIIKKSESEFKYLLNLGDGKQLQIDALSNLFYSPKSGRVITIGGKLYEHAYNIMSIYIYDLDGKAISKQENFVKSVHATSIDSYGTIWIAGMDNNNPQDLDVYLHRVNKDGQIEHRVNLGLVNVQEIYTSEFGRTALLLKPIEQERSSFLRIYPSGFIANPIDIAEVSTLTGIEFLSNNEFVVCKSREWIRFSITETVKILGRGELVLNTLSRFPITDLGQGKFALIHYLNSEYMAGFRIDIIGSNNKLMFQFIGNETHYKAKYRMLEFEQGKLKFNNGEKVLVFDLAY